MSKCSFKIYLLPIRLLALIRGNKKEVMLEGSLKIPQEWRDSAEEIASLGGPALAIGAPGSGKS